MSPRLSIFALAGTILFGAMFMFSNANTNIYESKNVWKLENRDINLIVVNNSENRTKGLGGMNSLPINSAMLFTFDEPDKYGIWMKDMKFPIDIIWLDEQKKIILIDDNVSPDTYPRVFFPPEKSLYILETNSGFAIENNLKVGNFLNFTLK